MIFDFLFLRFKLKKIEDKLRCYNGYEYNSIYDWKNATKLKWKVLIKILNNITIYTSRDIREMLRNLVSENRELFSSKNLYITNFGNAGKSGGIILYEFLHSNAQFKSKVIHSWEIINIPSDSIIIFFDDLVGTGRQSVKYINEQLNLFIKPTHQCYLLCLCATQDGLSRLADETNFNIRSSVILSNEEHNFLSPSCSVFDAGEKTQIEELNNMLQNEKVDDYNMNLLVAFYHTVPNNTMPIIWKNKYKFQDKQGKSKEWFAILPRYY